MAGKEIERSDAIENPFVPVFVPVLAGPRRYGMSGTQIIYRFPNGYGASVIDGFGAYGVELAVLSWKRGATLDEDFDLEYGTPITDNVIGYNSEQEIIDLLTQISELSPKAGFKRLPTKKKAALEK